MEIELYKYLQFKRPGIGLESLKTFWEYLDSRNISKRFRIDLNDSKYCHLENAYGFAKLC